VSPPRVKTRDRILTAALRLFNEQRFGSVSTAAIAAEVGIAEGNLWYHFRSKRALLDAISADFAEAIEERLRMRPSDAGDLIEEYVGLLACMQRELHTFRFIYRDRADYGESSPIILDHIGGWYDRVHEQLSIYLGAMIDRGLLDWPRVRLGDLCTNALLILRFGLEYQREMDPAAVGDLDSARWTVERHLTLFEDRLDPAAARRFHRAIEQADLQS
jgi:AcrR family transcriptional regulator